MTGFRRVGIHTCLFFPIGEPYLCLYDGLTPSSPSMGCNLDSASFRSRRNTTQSWCPVTNSPMTNRNYFLSIQTLQNHFVFFPHSGPCDSWVTPACLTTAVDPWSWHSFPYGGSVGWSAFVTAFADWPVYASEAAYEWVGLGRGWEGREESAQLLRSCGMNLLTRKPEDSIRKIRIPQIPVPWGLLLSLVSAFPIQPVLKGGASFRASTMQQ